MPERTDSNSSATAERPERRRLKQRRCGLAWFNLLLPCGIMLWAVCYLGAGPRVGDGAEYFLTMISLAENGTPYVTEHAGTIYDEYFALSDNTVGFEQIKNSSGVLRRDDIPRGDDIPRRDGGQFECHHFWFFSALAALFYWPLKFNGLDIGLSFTLLNVTLLFLATRLADECLGPRGALAVLLLAIFSPALWFIDKGHIEFFTIMTTTIAMSYFLSRRYAPSAVWFAVASTQNPPFALLGLIAWGFGLAEEKWRFFALHKTALIAGVVVMGMHPAYYLTKYGVLTPTLLTGHGKLGGNWLPIKQMTALWIDPDLGMFANWLPALPIMGLSLALCCTGRV